MSTLSIFIDESGDFGPYSTHSPYYIIALLMHDQDNSIKEQVDQLRSHVKKMGFDENHAIHSAPLIRREKNYAHMDLPSRRKLFRYLLTFMRLCDIASGNMGVLIGDGEVIGTGCFDGNHITGVYVLPTFQGKGCGSMIIEHLECLIGKDHEMVVLDASLPAASLYEHRGYRTVGHGTINLENDVKLVFEKMEKRLQ